MPKRTITVNDKMQKGYRYALTAPAGRNFDPEFRPELTPKEMLALGVFCGKYMTDCREDFPELVRARRALASGRDSSLNYFGIDAASRSRCGAKGWIHPDDPRGWFQWYCRYYMGRRMPDEDRARSSAGRRSGGTSRRSRSIASRRPDVPPASATGAAALGLRQPQI